MWLQRRHTIQRQQGISGQLHEIRHWRRGVAARVRWARLHEVQRGRLVHWSVPGQKPPLRPVRCVIHWLFLRARAPGKRQNISAPTMTQLAVWRQTRRGCYLFLFLVFITIRLTSLCCLIHFLLVPSYAMTAVLINFWRCFRLLIVFEKFSKCNYDNFLSKNRN